MKLRSCILAISLVAPNSLLADEATHRVYAKPVVRQAPTYPASELRRGRQGWVELSYVVNKEGKVIDPVVQSSSGSSRFESAAIRAVERFEYSPATINGEPVQQCITKTRISFAIDGGQTSVSRRFYSQYRRVDKLLDNGEIDLAEEKVKEILSSNASMTIGELSWTWALRARIHAARGDEEAELAAIRRTSAGSSKWIPDKLRIGLLKTQFMLEVNSVDYSNALATYASLAEISSKDLAEYTAVADKISTLVDSDRLFYKTAEIGGSKTCETCATQWKYKPLRRAVEIAEVSGELKDIELRCDWQRFVDAAREGVTWNIPKSWGDCSVVVHGTPGTTFKFYEIPNS